MRRAIIGSVALAAVALVVVWLVVARRGPATARAQIKPGLAIGPLTLRTGGGSIAGTVRDVAKPIAKAAVCVDAASGATVCVATDAHGRYAIGALPEGVYHVTAAADGFRPGRYRAAGERIASSVALASKQRMTAIDIVLEPGAVKVTGNVVDVSGGPIARARLRAHIGWGDESKLVPPVESDDAGAFTLWAAPGDFQVTAIADGYAEATVGATAPGTLTILMTPEASISGTVVDGKGAPVPDAEVAADYVDVHVKVRSDDRGAFRIPSLVPARYELHARVEHGYGEAAHSVLVGLGQQVTGVVIRIDPAARLVGHVMADGGTPCPDATVKLRSVEHGERMLVRAADGTFHADALIPGTYYAHPTCAGQYADRRYPPIVIADQDVDVTWKLHAAAVVRGTARDRKGAPLADVTVELHATEIGYVRDTTLPDGTYVIDGVAPGTYKLQADTQRAGHVEHELVVTSAGPMTHDLTIDEGATISGTVRDTAGHPASGMEVHASGDKPQRDVAGPDGTYSLAVTPGTYKVQAASDWQHMLGEPQTVTVASGQTVKADFVVPPHDGVIRGDVVDASGKPVGDAYVQAHKADLGDDAWSWTFDDRPVLTAPDGTFEIKGIGPGSYMVEAVRRGGGEARQKGVAAGDTVHLALPTSGSIAGTVRFADGKPPAELSIVVRDKPNEFYRHERAYHSDGVFLLDQMPPGELTLIATADNGLGVATVTLGPGEAKTGVEIVMDRYVPVTGRVVDAFTKQPLENYFVVPRTKRALLGTVADSDDVSHMTDATGRFAITAPPGPVALEVSPMNFLDRGACRMSLLRTLTGPFDTGDIAIVRSRIAAGKKGTLKLPIESSDIVSIDGITGETLQQCKRSLMSVPAGTTVKIGLANGKTVDLVAGPPADD